MRIFVGCSADGSDCESQAVLEYTLRAHTREPVDLTWLKADPTWNTKGWSTPFTGLRWAIPEICANRGRAIYLDSDTLLKADIAELWSQPMPEGAFALVKGEGKKLRTCVMVLDCEAAKDHLPPVKAMKRMNNVHAAISAMLADVPQLTGQIEGIWNCVDLKGCGGLDDPNVKLIHYSSIAHQPHLRHALRRLARQGRRHWYDGERFDHWRPELIEHFDKLLAEARVAGFSVERYEPAEPYTAPMKSYKDVRVKGYSTW